MPSTWAMTGEGRTGIFNASHIGEHLSEVLWQQWEHVKGVLFVSESSFTDLFIQQILVICSRPGPVLSAGNAMIHNNKILILQLC